MTNFVEKIQIACDELKLAVLEEAKVHDPTFTDVKLTYFEDDFLVGCTTKQTAYSFCCAIQKLVLSNFDEMILSSIKDDVCPLLLDTLKEDLIPYQVCVAFLFYFQCIHYDNDTLEELEDTIFSHSEFYDNVFIKALNYEQDDILYNPQTINQFVEIVLTSS